MEKDKKLTGYSRFKPLQEELLNLRKENTSLKARIENIHRLLRDLTLGGSEFINDSEDCIKWVRENINSESKALKGIIVSTKARIVLLEDALNMVLGIEDAAFGLRGFDAKRLKSEIKKALNQK